MKVCLSQGSSGSTAWDQILYVSTLLWSVIWGTGVKDKGDVWCRMHSLSIVVLQVHPPEHSLKQCIYYLMVSVRQKSRSSLLACLSLGISQEAANKPNARAVVTPRLDSRRWMSAAFTSSLVIGWWHLFSAIWASTQGSRHGRRSSPKAKFQEGERKRESERDRVNEVEVRVFL